MTRYSPPGARWLPHVFALVSLTLLAGCIDSAAPVLTDAKPLLGERLHLQFYGLHEGTAHEPESGTYTFRGDRYVLTGGSAKDIGDFTLHEFEGADLMVQNIRAGRAVEYALARKLAEGTYLVFPIDETDADEATRTKLCSRDGGAACRVTTRDQVVTFARATAAKPHTNGGLAIVLADH